MGLLLFPTLLAGAQVKSKSLSAGADLIGHGKYIAQQVAMYVECHTPRDDDGASCEPNCCVRQQMHTMKGDRHVN